MIRPVGLHIDNSPIDQPENTARFALNAVLDTTEGDMYTYSKEQANQLSHSLPDDYEFVGSIKLDNNNVILFSTNLDTSEIGLFNRGEYQALINTPCLNFQVDKAVKGKYRIIKGCERIIYFVDSYNTDKAINIDQLDDYKDNNGDWDCNLMKLNPNYLIPEVTITSVNNSGGELESGSYAFAVELLDNDLNSIAVGSVTNYIPIYNDQTSDSYDSIRGSLTDINPSVEGGTSSTNKSIDLTLTNLDTRFAFARIIVIARNTGRGLAEEAYELLDYIPISDGQIDYRFTDISNAVRTDVESVRVKTAKYTRSTAIDIVDSRLVRANTQEDERDYSDFQIVTNDIEVTYGVTVENAEDITEPHNSKNPLSYQNGNTWIGDEVYALGIQYIFQDGTISPVFHIPGRAITNSDEQLLTVGDEIELEDVAHLDLGEGEQIQRWKYENTAEPLSQTNPKGKLGYYQTNTTYPTDLDCNGTPIYGDLAGQPIRHHRIPCRSLVPTYYISQGQVKLQKIYLNFDNINYPSDDIVDHRIVKAIRTERDKTVLDSGLVFNDSIVTGDQVPDTEDNYVFSKFYNGTPYRHDTVKGIVSPRILAGEDLNFDYIKYHRAIGGINLELQQETRSDITVNTTELDFIFSPQYSFNGLYRSVQNKKLMSPNSLFNGDFDQPVVNLSRSNSIVAVELNSDNPLSDGLTGGFFISTVSLKRNNQPYGNLYQIQYEPIGRDNYGYGFINRFDIYNISTSINNESSVNYLDNIYIETDINYDLRVRGTDCNTIYSRSQDLMDYSFDKVSDLNGNDRVPTNICPEYYRYNLDYQPRSGEAVQLPVPFNFDYCSECLTKYPNRIVWSPKSFSEQITDNFRINLVNDFLTVGESKGQIIDLHYEKNRLLVWTEDSVFLLTPNPRVINTDVDTAYVGTGDFLGVPAVEFAQVNHGFGGMQSRLASINTEQGIVWCDQQAGKIYTFNGQIKDLTPGLFTWLRSNLQGDIGDFNLQLSYDPYYQRVIVHKKQFVNVGVNPKNGQELIANRSWTLSYSFKFNTWVSWHTWHPKLMFADRDQFYSTMNNSIYNHNSNSYNNFYGIDGKFQIEYVDRSALTVDLDTIVYYASPSDYPTFNQFIVYNNNQSTGIQELQEDNGYYQTWSNMIKIVTSSQDNYRISQIRNLNTANPTTTNNWSDIQSEYTNGQGFIDKLPANIDYNINQWKLEPMRHKYFQIRLISTTDEQIVFHLTQTTKRHKEL